MGRKEDVTARKLIKQLFDILLLLVNSIGIVGAFLEILEIPWDSARDRILLWGVLFLFCATSVPFWHRTGENRKRMLGQGCACLASYVFLAVMFRKTLFGGLSLALQNAVQNLNDRYQFHLIWPDGLAILHEAGWQSGSEIWIITISVLFLLLPLVLLAGFLLTYGDCFWLLLGNGLWFVAACACNKFPDIFFLIFCVLGIVAVLVRKEFEENPGAGILAVVCVMLLAGGCIGLVCRFLLPVVDVQYEEGYEGRMQFYDLVNEEWIPMLQRVLPDHGFGSGPDVTGAFHRQSFFAYTTEEVYRVTMDSVPGETLYLKGYVGVSYGKKEWISQSDQELREYYEQHGLELPEDFAQLANISYMVVNASQKNISPGSILIEELGGKGSYSVYPYGAMLSKEYRVYGDGSVARKDREYGFQYRSLSNIFYADGLQEPWKRLEEQYRQYVYDSFLEYPEELTLLAERLEQEDVRTETVYACVRDIVDFLKRQASYNLDAEKNPSGEDFVEYFLFDSHEGYCVHFASAAVLALRYFGIPARYVTGYVVSPSDFSKGDGDSYTAVVTGRQAHAWAEVYLDGKGWVPVEATPGAAAFAGDTPTGLLFAGEPDQSEDTWKGETNTPAAEPNRREEEAEDLEPSVPESDLEPGSNQEPEPEQVKDSSVENSIEEQNGKKQEGAPGGQGNPGSAAAVQDPDGTGWIRIIPIVIGLAVLAAVLFLGKYLYDRRRRLWHDRMQEAGARLRILFLYRNMRKVLRAAGCPMKLDAEEEGFWQALSRACPGVGKEEYGIVYGILEKAGFGDAEPSEEELRVVCGFHDRLVKEVYESAPFYKKPLFMCTCMLPVRSSTL